MGIAYVGKKLADRAPYDVPLLADIPLLGTALFKQHPTVYLTMLAAGALAWFFFRTRTGLVLRSVGESPESAHALGYRVRWLRLGAVMAGGALCGMAGAYLSVVYAPLWAWWQGVAGLPWP